MVKVRSTLLITFIMCGSIKVLLATASGSYVTTHPTLHDFVKGHPISQERRE
jgi:hypothetical protein